MSLSASMWTSVSGLMTHGEKMNVIGNNIANVSTIGFKAQRADFSDFFYTNYGTASGVDQVGKGTRIAALIGDFSQGGFESTNSATDLAINGNGFFQVRNENTDGKFYTRAGDFYFNNKRELVNPDGLHLQGWKTSQEKSVSISTGTVNLNKAEEDFRRVGTPTDIVLDQWNLPPERTKNITIANNLVNNDKYDVTSSKTSPLTALFDSWNAQNDPPISDTAYATQSTIKAYDDSGSPHDITVYMDKVKAKSVDAAGNMEYEINNLPDGYSIYEYLVTINPEEDKRTYEDSGTIKTFYDETDKNPTKTTKDTLRTAGILMSGVMIFDSAGTLVSQSAYTYGGKDGSSSYDRNNSTPKDDSKCSLDPTDKKSWQPTEISSNGLPVFTANFSGKGLANTVRELDAGDNIIELDLGLNNSSNSWTTSGSLDDLQIDTSTNTVDYNSLALMSGAVRDDNATANNGSTFVTDIQDDGYASGVLSNYSIDSEGVVYGYYSNGESIPLYQLAMYDFHSTQGLYREGGNLYSQTQESGRAVEGVAGNGTFGNISSYYIENSNVDMSREFVHMISCQRGFQANSKSITTTDTMLETVIGMKR